jgi:hypothetical protein
VNGSLLEAIFRILRRTYALEAPLLPIDRYVIGDLGLRSLYAGGAVEVRSEAGEGGRLLVRETASGVRACIYFPDAMIRHLEANPPQLGLDDRNVDAFAVLVEEIDHLLVAAERAHAGRGVSLLELELQANVSKDLVLARFLAGRRPRLDAGRKVWLRHHLFHKRAFCDGDERVRARYDDASRFALRFLRRLEWVPAAERVERLRRFHRAPLSTKLSMIEEGPERLPAF